MMMTHCYSRHSLLVTSKSKVCPDTGGGDLDPTSPGRRVTNTLQEITWDEKYCCGHFGKI